MAALRSECTTTESGCGPDQTRTDCSTDASRVGEILPELSNAHLQAGASIPRSPIQNIFPFNRSLRDSGISNASRQVRARRPAASNAFIEAGKSPPTHETKYLAILSNWNGSDSRITIAQVCLSIDKDSAKGGVGKTIILCSTLAPWSANRSRTPDIRQGEGIGYSGGLRSHAILELDRIIV